MSIKVATAVCMVVASLAAAPAAQAQFDFQRFGRDLLKNLQPDAAEALTVEDMGAGLKEALRVGTESVVGQLGAVDGFNADQAVHIPLPDHMATVRATLAQVGMSGMLDDLELRLNRAAELATPRAKAIFWDAITAMTWTDARQIYEGADDAATRYFEGRTSKPIADAMRPIVDASLAEVGAIQAYDNVMGQFGGVQFVPDVKSDLTEWALTKALAGMFHYLAIEEAAIRDQPAKRTTDLLKRVFGGA